ncbi:ATP-binding protein [Collinsella sp. zg1085]|uniref:DnaA ATPase domain-containing protein n=1 Tax=Collinsella sp. zg1085 TaxID=2844380 RepID=UPI001C0AD685|nr:DnaA/Hda family protein [Collinsella sp. zg1085]QWT17603.1 ATP-binding protein [Collinsella sp. zg1085]
MESDAKLLLDDTVAYLSRDKQEERLIHMLLQSRPTTLEEDTLTIEAPNRFALTFLERNRALIESYLKQVAFTQITLVIKEPSHQPIIPNLQTDGVFHTQTNASPSSEAFINHEQTVPSQDNIATPISQHTARDTQMPTPPALKRSQTDGESADGIKVSNTISKDEFVALKNRMNNQLSSVINTAQAQKTSANFIPQPDEAFQPIHINSKFTFANFVYGDENKHAYHSAQRFAAFADEPGQSNSLFIYGGSGLGKTHLLLAIKNYLAETKPYIQVKYANSQVYIDDFINEIAQQKTQNRAILQDYHKANILIIDDIQNIIGKQASIEYFFSLMDEFIRENKKIVIASDRAPKKLGMDERLTSRFNAGMLCLVSEPGFEMKYTILKRYYETIIRGGNDGAVMNVDASLLGALHPREGKLTDEQLRHMAEISGNNIRELESFCERCASLSFEREQAGLELSAEDIEQVADEYFDTVHKVIHVDTIQDVVEEFYHVSHEELVGPKRSRDIAFARHVAVYLANSLCDLSSKAIGEQFGGRDHSTVINSLKVVEKKIKEDRRICDDLQQLKNKITLRS